MGKFYYMFTKPLSNGTNQQVKAILVKIPFYFQTALILHGLVSIGC